MRRNVVAVVITLVAALGVAGFSTAGAGCCVIPPHAAAASSANAKVVHLQIEGMTCGSCATAVRHVLTNVDGVKAANVSFEKKNAVVTYEPAKVTPEKIARAVEEKLPTYKAKVVSQR